MTTKAEQIAELFGDGQCWHDADGYWLLDVCHARCVQRDVSRDGNAKRYKFKDGSVITAVSGGWDLGYPDCWCWRGEGHRDGCDAEVLS